MDVRKFLRILGLVFFLCIFLFIYIFLYQRIWWLDSSDARIKLISMVNFQRYYKNIAKNNIGLLLVHIEGEPKKAKAYNVFGGDDDGKLLFGCYWRSSKIFNIPTEIWRMGIYFDVEKLESGKYKDEAIDSIISHDINSCLTKFNVSNLNSNQVLELDMKNYETMKKYNKDQIFQLVDKKIN